METNLPPNLWQETTMASHFPFFRHKVGRATRSHCYYTVQLIVMVVLALVFARLLAVVLTASGAHLLDWIAQAVAACRPVPMR